MTALKIGLITDNYPAFMATGKSPAGGIGSYTQLVAEELAGRGHEVHVFAYAPVGDIERQAAGGVTVWGCPTWNRRREMSGRRSLEYTLRYRRRHHPSRYPLLLAAREAAGRHKFDVIESPDLATMGAIVESARLSRCFAVRLHCIITEQCGNRLLDAPAELRRRLADFISRADVVTAPTRFVLQSTRDALEADLVTGCVVGNPVRMRPLEPRHATLPQEAVFFGRIFTQKGPDLLAAAVPRIRREIPRFKATFIGPDLLTHHMRSSHYLRQVAGDDADACVFRGQMPHHELAKEVRRYGVCVLPSRWETFGMTLIEAMSWGCPVVASDIGPFRELSEEGTYCRLAESDSVEDVALAVVETIRNPPSVESLEASWRHASNWSVESVVTQALAAWGQSAAEDRPATRTNASGRLCGGVA